MTSDRTPAESDDVDLPRSGDVGELCNNRAVTTCCGAFVTFHDTTLCCKQCWREIA